MPKRVLFVGATGSGKSTLINILFNNNVKKEAMGMPARADDTSSGVTSIFTTYYDIPNYAYTDSIGFGDSRFNQLEVFSCLKAVIKQSMIGYNRIYLCVRYGRISQEIRDYIEFLTTVFDDGILRHCTIIFTHCKDKLMTKQLFLEKNTNDNDICCIVRRVQNVIFGDNNVDDDEEVEKVLLTRRKHFLDQIKIEIDNSNENYYVPQPSDVVEWINRILSIMLTLIKRSWSMSRKITTCVLMHSELQRLAQFCKEGDTIRYQEYYGDCSICLDSMWSTNSTITKCHHIFHRQCLLQLKNPLCPLCAAAINLSPEANQLVARY